MRKLIFALLGILIAACSINKKAEVTVDSQFDRLMGRAVALGNQRAIMPIDLFDLAHEFSELKNQDLVTRRLVDEAMTHESSAVRRIAIHASLRSKRYSTPGLKEAITARLQDKNPWVRYDAAWLIKDANYYSAAILDSLHAMTLGMPYEEARKRQSINPGDYDAAAALQAYETLASIKP